MSVSNRKTRSQSPRDRRGPINAQDTPQSSFSALPTAALDLRFVFRHPRFVFRVRLPYGEALRSRAAAAHFHDAVVLGWAAWSADDYPLLHLVASRGERSRTHPPYSKRSSRICPEKSTEAPELLRNRYSGESACPTKTLTRDRRFRLSIRRSRRFFQLLTRGSDQATQVSPRSTIRISGRPWNRTRAAAHNGGAFAPFTMGGCKRAFVTHHLDYSVFRQRSRLAS